MECKTPIRRSLLGCFLMIASVASITLVCAKLYCDPKPREGEYFDGELASQRARAMRWNPIVKGADDSLMVCEPDYNECVDLSAAN